MLRAEQMLNTINKRVVNWTFSNVHTTAEKAKKEAAQLLTLDDVQGVTVRDIGKSKFVTLFWKKENTSNE